MSQPLVAQPTVSPSDISPSDISQCDISQCDQRSTPVSIEQLMNPPGEGSCHNKEEHTLFLSLASRPLHYVQVQDGQTFTGIYRQGDILITPADTQLFVQWTGDEKCAKIQLKAEFLRHVARETLKPDCDTFQLQPAFQVRNPLIEAMTQLLLSESQQPSVGSQLYLDSLANALAVQLLRNHVTTRPQVPTYEGGLPPHQLRRILDYVDAHLDQDLRLEHLAQLLDMSQFHFSRLFKQSIGSSPYHYLIQQRVERAKQFLKQSDRSIVEIALECGFSSHSHLSRQFRQVTGMTPKAYRTEGSYSLHS